MSKLISLRKLTNHNNQWIVPLNKVGEYCKGEDENTTLPIEYNYVKTLSILNNEARKTIATTMDEITYNV